MDVLRLVQKIFFVIALIISIRVAISTALIGYDCFAIPDEIPEIRVVRLEYFVRSIFSMFICGICTKTCALCIIE